MRRRIEHKLDILPITANSCNYPTRFNSCEMRESGSSLEVCALAMFLLNGEVIRDSDHIIKMLSEMKLPQYLQYISLDKFDPPVDGKELSFTTSGTGSAKLLTAEDFLNWGTTIAELQCEIHHLVLSAPESCNC